MCLLLAPSPPLGLSWGPPGGESLGPLVFFPMMRSRSIAVYCIITTMRLMVLDWCLRARTALHCAKIKTSRCLNAAERIKSHTFSHREFTIHESKLQWHHRFSSIFRRGEKSLLLVSAPIIKHLILFFSFSLHDPRMTSTLFWQMPLCFCSLFFRASTYLYLICHRNVCRSFMLPLCPFSFLLVSRRAEFSQFFTVCAAATMPCCRSQLKGKMQMTELMYFHVRPLSRFLRLFSESGQVHVRHTGLSNRTNTM